MWYRVTSRGNERRGIFRDDNDRIRSLNALQESIEQFNVEVRCYALMSNHFYFLLRTREANLNRFMKRSNTAYTTYYNFRLMTFLCERFSRGQQEYQHQA